MIQGILFDMDGVLFNTEELSLGVCAEVAQRRQMELPKNFADEVCGTSHEHYEQFMLASFGEGFDFEGFYAECRAGFDAKMALGVPEKPFLHETLEALKQMGLAMAVASSTRQATVLHHLEEAGIRHYFSAVIGGDMVEHTKPDPTIFRLAAEALNLAPEDCLVVEDSVNGIYASSAAGCTTVMIPDMMPATDKLRALCAAVLPSLEGLPALVQSLREK